jgi:hypothetical protein
VHSVKGCASLALIVALYPVPVSGWFVPGHRTLSGYVRVVAGMVMATAAVMPTIANRTIMPLDLMLRRSVPTSKMRTVTVKSMRDVLSVSMKTEMGSARIPIALMMIRIGVSRSLKSVAMR